MKKHIKRYLTDLAGIILIIVALLIGWLPGPGGIPLILAGLALLAINNKWAEDILIKLRDKGEDLVKIIYPPNKKIQIMHDILTIIFLISGLFLVITNYNKYLLILGIILLILTVSEFLFNRNRISIFSKKR